MNAPIVSPESRTKIIGVASGKGGVGKSTVTVNLAVSLEADGLRRRPSRLRHLRLQRSPHGGLEDRRPTVIDGKILPLPAFGMKVISMGNFVEEETPVVWRGPMLGKILRQFLNDVVWGEPDFLLLDLPPGTGDMALDVAQLMPKARLLVVTTPQVVAASVATRAAQMAKKTNQEILGVVENMAAFICPHCGESTPIFGEGGGSEVAERLGVPLLGSIPALHGSANPGTKGSRSPSRTGRPRKRRYRDLAGEGWRKPR